MEIRAVKFRKDGFSPSAARTAPKLSTRASGTAEHDGAAFEDLPEDWKCPRCRQPGEKFNKA